MSASSQNSGNIVQAGNEDLTDEQIDALLKEAEQRLTAAASSFSPPPIHSLVPFTPKHPAFSRPYIRTISQIAHVDPSRMVDKKQREVSARSVASKPAAKKREVSFYQKMEFIGKSLKKVVNFARVRIMTDLFPSYSPKPTPVPNGSTCPPPTLPLNATSNSSSYAAS